MDPNISKRKKQWNFLNDQDLNLMIEGSKKDIKQKYGKYKGVTLTNQVSETDMNKLFDIRALRELKKERGG